MLKKGKYSSGATEDTDYPNRYFILILTVPHTLRDNLKGRDSTTEQSLGENAAELVGWDY